MSVDVLFGLLFFCVILYKSERTFASHPEEKNLSDILNALLSHSQWTKITKVEARYPDYQNDFVSFSGKDLCIYRGLYSRAKNTENSLFSVDDVFKKHYMVTCLLGCVYGHAIDTFTTIIKNILSISRSERQISFRRTYDQLRRNGIKNPYQDNIARKPMLSNQPNITERERSRKKVLKEYNRRKFNEIVKNMTSEQLLTYNLCSQSKKRKTILQKDGEKVDSREDNKNEQNVVNDKGTYYLPPTDNLIPDVEVSRVNFNFACQQLLDSQPMFQYMYDALMYLSRLIPTDEFHLHTYLADVKKLLGLTEWYKDIQTNLSQLFPTDTSVNNDDYDSKVVQFSKILSLSIISRNQYKHKPFVTKHCMFPKEDNQPIKLKLKNFKKDFPLKNKNEIIFQFEKQIQELFKNVINNLYLDLGFVFTGQSHFDVYS